MKLNFRIIAKLGLLMVVIGFFMPVSCNMNGFEVADFMMQNDMAGNGLLMYLLILSAFTGVLVGILLIAGKKVRGGIDWAAIIACIASGLIVNFSGDWPELQSGAYMILTGWIIALGAQIIFALKGKR